MVWRPRFTIDVSRMAMNVPRHIAVRASVGCPRCIPRCVWRTLAYVMPARDALFDRHRIGEATAELAAVPPAPPRPGHVGAQELDRDLRRRPVRAPETHRRGRRVRARGRRYT